MSNRRSTSLAPTTRFSQLRMTLIAGIVAISMPMSGAAMASGPQKAVLSSSTNSKKAETADASAKSDSTEKTDNQVNPAPAPVAAPLPQDSAPIAPSPAGPPPPKGTGMIVGGSLIGALLGVPLTLAGVVGLAAINTAEKELDANDVNEKPVKDAAKLSKGLVIGGCLIPGIISLAGGTAMVVFGAKRNGRHRRWRQGQRNALKTPVFTPMVATTRMQTGLYGIQGRF